MRSKPRPFAANCLSACLAATLVAPPVVASTPNNLSDIEYQSTEWGSEQLRFRGYTRISADHHHGKEIEYWWNPSSKTCVRTDARDDKYESISTTTATDCNQYHADATKNDNAAAVAIGAAALIGIAALAHKSHDRDDKHGDDSKSVAEFERGYRDGLHHERYHNYNDTTAYSDGYQAGQTERDEKTRYRSQGGHHSGYHAYVSVDDLVGARASSADSEMRSRGFDDVGGYKQDGKSYVTWYNTRSRQCVSLVTKDGRIKRINAIDEGNCT